MERRNSIEEVERLIGEKVNLTEEANKVNEFFQLFQRSKKQPCPDSDEDCSDLLSACCEAILTTIFSTLPLKVECSACKKSYFLRDVLKEEKRAESL